MKTKNIQRHKSSWKIRQKSQNKMNYESTEFIKKLNLNELLEAEWASLKIQEEACLIKWRNEPKEMEINSELEKIKRKWEMGDLIIFHVYNCFPKETNFPELEEDLNLQTEKANRHTRKNQYRMTVLSQV